MDRGRLIFHLHNDHYPLDIDYYTIYIVNYPG